MANFDSFNYEIERRMPEWWKGFGLLEPVNKYVQEIIVSILEDLLTNTGVAQPINCWLTIPEEYHWFHHYQELDSNLIYINNGEIIENPVNTILGGDNDKIIALLPNTKRKCHAKIRLKLTGYSEDSDIKDSNIESLIIKNANQIIEIQDISKTSLIEISTENHEILIDGKPSTNLTTGFFDKIQPTIKYDDYLIPYIDKEGNLQKKEMDLEYENKQTTIELQSSDPVNFDLQIQLYKPTYVTEQNIRIATVSAFPIEWVRLYGYFCHPFNKKEGYKFLWEKKYSLESRTVYDKIAKQYDCERFYIQVKFHGIGIPISKGFPQEEYANDTRFQINEKLDKWGKIFGLPRRYYKENITEDEEPFTFPKYYPYPIEQDYWYEERMVNEYRFDDEHFDSYFVKDSDLNNIAELRCIYPFMNDIWVYTETINPDIDITHESEPIRYSSLEEISDTEGVSWNIPNNIEFSNDFITLEPFNDETIKTNLYPYKTKGLKVTFNLHNFDIVEESEHETYKFKSYSDNQGTVLWGTGSVETTGITSNGYTEVEVIENDTDQSFIGQKFFVLSTAEPDDDNYYQLYTDAGTTGTGIYVKIFDKNTNREAPKDIKIKGMELKFESETGIHSEYLMLSEISQILLPVFSKNDPEPIIEPIYINDKTKSWKKGSTEYIIGGETNLFGQEEITRDQLVINHELSFVIGFINENDFIETYLKLKNIELKIYYEIIKDDYSIDMKLNQKEFLLSKEETNIIASITITNNGKKKIIDKEAFLIYSPELELKNNFNSFKFDIDINEDPIKIDFELQPKEIDGIIKTGYYDIILFCEDTIIKEEILIREG